MIKPIKPSEVDKKREAKIPDYIIECVNEMIISNWDGLQSKIYQKDLMEKVLDKNDTLSRTTILADHFFDFENIFRKAGWLVEYDKPGYNESYDAYFVFKKKRSK